MIDPHSLQCLWQRSHISWRGGKWPVTNDGAETTDPRVPHVVIPTRYLDRTKEVLEGSYSPVLRGAATWFDHIGLELAIKRARIVHHRGLITLSIRSNTEIQYLSHSRLSPLSAASSCRTCDLGDIAWT